MNSFVMALRCFSALRLHFLLTFGFALLLMLFVPFVLAQDGMVVVGKYSIPPELWALISAAVGWLVKEIASPITALVKRYGATHGTVTRVVYILLVTLITAIFGLATGAFGQGVEGWTAAGIAFVTAVLKGLGDYVKLQQSTKSGVEAAEPIRSVDTPTPKTGRGRI
ncbi:hypothetical protein [Deinococcus peraridilitoris]|uniref:Uncharacterized protein n=1 Tax=Deinococcus peraridilitoris (strain DSM 19664 / LMG 22246 / CIP 109416 / KR-200) TaxID=937777 RepID=K9ZZI0_DEIPD|nr:hypothetical protein [Deinococcus peraridilitoris]AFZ67053.1 hypothetical protein Deipe_1512 [Deinococcus peraridilitoris DSM 19664]